MALPILNGYVYQKIIGAINVAQSVKKSCQTAAFEHHPTLTTYLSVFLFTFLQDK